VFCPSGHKCNLTRQPYVVDSDNNDMLVTEFKCKICDKKGKFKDIYYVCAYCKYYAHEKCANYDNNSDSPYYDNFPNYDDGI